MAVTRIEKECDKKMADAVTHLKSELKGIRAGRAHPGLVEHIRIEVASYGSSMELRELATISVPEPATLLVKPFDPTNAERYREGPSNLEPGCHAQQRRQGIRLPIPPLSGERRTQLVGEIKKMGETQKVVVRNARRDANKDIDAAQKAKTVSEDEAKDAKDRIQKLTKKHEDDIDSIAKEKAKEIEEV